MSCATASEDSLPPEMFGTTRRPRHGSTMVFEVVSDNNSRPYAETRFFERPFRDSLNGQSDIVWIMFHEDPAGLHATLKYLEDGDILELGGYYDGWRRLPVSSRIHQST